MLAVPLLGALLALFPAQAFADEHEESPQVFLRGDAWYADSSGWIFITRGSRPGTATRARDGSDFRLDPEVLPAADVGARLWDGISMGFRAVPARESGTHTASQGFVYHGNSYPAGRQIRAEAGFLLMDLDFQYRWNVGEGFAVTPHVGAEYWGFSSRLRTVDAGPPIDEKRSFSSGYWLAGADAEARIAGSLGARVSLLGGATGTDRYFLEAEAGLVLELFRQASLTASYRVHDVRFHTSTNEANLIFFGPSVGVDLHF